MGRPLSIEIQQYSLRPVLVGHRHGLKETLVDVRLINTFPKGNEFNRMQHRQFLEEVMLCQTPKEE